MPPLMPDPMTMASNIDRSPLCEASAAGLAGLGGDGDGRIPLARRMLIFEVVRQRRFRIIEQNDDQLLDLGVGRIDDLCRSHQATEGILLESAVIGIGNRWRCLEWVCG